MGRQCSSGLSINCGHGPAAAEIARIGLNRTVVLACRFPRPTPAPPNTGTPCAETAHKFLLSFVPETTLDLLSATGNGVKWHCWDSSCSCLGEVHQVAVPRRLVALPASPRQPPLSGQQEAVAPQTGSFPQRLPLRGPHPPGTEGPARSQPGREPPQPGREPPQPGREPPQPGPAEPGPAEPRPPRSPCRQPRRCARRAREGSPGQAGLCRSAAPPAISRDGWADSALQRPAVRPGVGLPWVVKWS
nr:basic proline-rich protein-like [Taeniopygia guttata]